MPYYYQSIKLSKLHTSPTAILLAPSFWMIQIQICLHMLQHYHRFCSLFSFLSYRIFTALPTLPHNHIRHTVSNTQTLRNNLFMKQFPCLEILCVCMCVHMCVCAYDIVHVCVRACMRVCVPMHMFVPVCVVSQFFSIFICCNLYGSKVSRHDEESLHRKESWTAVCDVTGAVCCVPNHPTVLFVVYQTTEQSHQVWGTLTLKPPWTLQLHRQLKKHQKHQWYWHTVNRPALTQG